MCDSTPATRVARPLATSALFVTTVILLGGCAAIDARPDLSRSAALVSERSNVSADWTTPWDASLTSWDAASPLSQEAALAMALRNNRDLRAQVEQIVGARADLAQAGLLPNPMVTLAFRVPVDPVEGGTFLGAGVMQSFVALWLREGKVRAADARLNQVVLDVSDRAIRLAAEVKTMHARIAFGEQALRLADEITASDRRTIEVLDARVRGGEGTLLEVNRAKQLLAEAETQRIMATRELATDRRAMLELIGFPGASVTWTVAPVTEPAQGPADEAAAVALALSQRLDVAASLAMVEASAAELSLEERSRVRDLSLGMDVERGHMGEKSAGPVLNMEVPIFDTNAAQVARAGSAARAALASFEAASQRAVREVRVAWVEFESGRLLLEHHRTDVLQLAEENLTLAEAALRAGETDVTVFLEAQREVIRARRELLDAERALTLTAIELERAVGGLLSPR